MEIKRAAESGIRKDEDRVDLNYFKFLDPCRKQVKCPENKKSLTHDCPGSDGSSPKAKADFMSKGILAKFKLTVE